MSASIPPIYHQSKQRIKTKKSHKKHKKNVAQHLLKHKKEERENCIYVRVHNKLLPTEILVQLLVVFKERDIIYIYHIYGGRF